MKKIIGYTIIILLVSTLSCTPQNDNSSKTDAKDSSSIILRDFNLNNPKIIAVIKDYISNNITGPPRVFTLVIQRKDYLTTSMNLCSIGLYSTFNEMLPSGYFKIDDHLILVYTGLERFSEPDSKYVEELKSVIGNRLQNNLLPNGSINPDVNVPMYDPQAWEITLFKDSILANRDSARNVLGPPIQRVIKFVPPKEKK